MSENRPPECLELNAISDKYYKIYYKLKRIYSKTEMHRSEPLKCLKSYLNTLDIVIVFE
jgi:hypothetical protein